MERIVSSGYKPEVVVGVLRGGWVPAKLVADYLGVEEMAAVEVKSYAGVASRVRPVVTQPIVKQLRGKRVLVVDDVADTGDTFEVVVELAQLQGASEVRTAALYLKPWSRFKPDYVAYVTDAWVVFPWDLGETLEDLLARGFGLRDAAELLGVSLERVEELLRVRRSIR